MRIGIDLGGTKIEGIALEGGAELARIRVDTPRDDYGATLDAIGSLVGDLERRAGARGTVGVGIPGTLSPSTGVVKNANSVWLIGQPLLADLESRLDREVRIANDANCFAVSEAADGAARGAVVVFGVIVGTGVGGGIVVEGRVLTGRNVIAGEWGHNPLPWPSDEEWPGPLCYCGRTGCIETFLSGAGLAREHERRTGNRETPERIAAAADESNDTLATYEHRMSRALAGVINILDPDVIVLGGGLSNIERLYRNVPRLWEEFVLGVARLGSGRGREPVATRLVRAAHGDSSGVRGAAWLW